ncbi:hypothetical protein NEF87_003379 [Candidatus Lokiarchaeum ossiferum]|uniref:ABC transmembrane type-2 domain-containing protein n=1 Tax=Candidatus Lokiarchaeum ossiferum TaxID=2951803 RepID=A0ABY6HU96_9ARCH|nr:hypothetical protein NEF87_003379 [Candidatus Lokiarchaeum sp. B-35]
MKSSEKNKPGNQSSFSQFTGIFSKYLKISYRDRPSWFWVIGYPVLFMIIFTIGLRGSSVATFDVAFVSYDSIAWDGQNTGESVDFGSEFIIGFFEDPESPFNETITAIVNLNEEEARTQVVSGDIDALVIFPTNFSEILFDPAFPEGPQVEIFCPPDPTIQSIVGSIIEGLINQMIVQQENVSLSEIKIEASQEQIAYFDYLMPGVVVAGVTIAIMNIAQNMGREKERGLMERLDTTPVPRATQLLGNGSAQLVFSSIQIIILMLCLVIFGVEIHPEANWFLAFLNCFILAMTCIGFGLIVAALVKDSNAAGGLAWILILPFQFFGGTIAIFSAGFFNKIFPTYYAANAMRAILVQGLGMAYVLEDLLINLAFAIGSISLGLIVFSRKNRV